MLFILMSSWGYAPGVENEYNIAGLPSDLCIDVPVFTIDYHRELEGSECIVAHIENGTITFTGNCQENQKKKYLKRVTAVLLITHNEALFIISRSCIF